jgi:hypothetical protein
MAASAQRQVSGPSFGRRPVLVAVAQTPEPASRRVSRLMASRCARILPVVQWRIGVRDPQVGLGPDRFWRVARSSQGSQEGVICLPLGELFTAIGHQRVSSGRNWPLNSGSPSGRRDPAEAVLARPCSDHTANNGGATGTGGCTAWPVPSTEPEPLWWGQSDWGSHVWGGSANRARMFDWTFSTGWVASIVATNSLRSKIAMSGLVSSW